MKKTIAIAVVVFFMLTNFSYISNLNVSGESTNDEIVVSYIFDDLRIDKTTIDGNEYSRISICNDDLITYTAIPGEPRVPVWGSKIAIPYGQKVESVHVTKSDFESFNIDFKIEPAQGAVPIGYDGEITFDEPKDEIYNSDKPYPNIDYKIVTKQRFRGHDFLVLELFPVEFKPLTNELNFYKSMDVTVKTSAVSSLEDIDDNYRVLQKDLDQFKKMIDNPQIVEDEICSSTMTPTDETYEYVIITTNDLKSSSSGYTFDDLKNAKINAGLNTKIMTVEQIKNDYSGSNTQEKIRNFIKDAYNNWQTDYVLLAGDVSKVPVKDVTVQDEYWPRNSPCDLYYACLDSPAPDGTAACDLTAEVYVGRAPVESSSEVSNFVKKTLDYMGTTDGYVSNALFIPESLGSGFPSSRKMLEQCIGHCEDDGYVTDGLPEGNGEYEYVVTWSSSGAKSKLNTGDYHLVNHIGHSNTQMCMGMTSSEASSLRNDNYFFVYGQSCNAGNFEANDCFAEHLTVKNSNGGAFGVIMNSGYGWQYKSSTGGPNNRLCRQFFDALYGEKTPIFGQAFHDSKEDSLYVIDSPYMLFTYYSVVFLGDPSLVVKNTKPSLIYSPHLYDFGSMEKGETRSTTFKIWNLGSEQMTYTLSENCEWVSVTPTQGSSSSGKRDIITVTIDTTSLSDGEHNCYININSNIGDGIFIVRVRVGAVLAFNPQSYEECIPIGEQTIGLFKIWNDGLDALTYNLASNVDWITVSPKSGVSTGEYDAIVIMVDGSGLENGWHNGNIIIDSNAGNATFNVMIGVDGPNRPINIEPDHNATGVETNAKLNVMVNDPDEDTMKVCFYDALDDSLIGSVSNVQSGNNASVYWNDLDYGRTYSWYATANDSSMASRSSVFSFTTNSPPVFLDMYPVDGAMSASFGLKHLSLDIMDPDGDVFDWSISTDSNVGSNYSVSDSNGKKYCDVSGLLMNAEYNWTVTAVDNRGAEVTAVYSFKTEENTAPLPPSAIYPKDKAVDVNVKNLILNWSCIDPNQGDILSYNLYFGKTNNPEIIEENINDTFYEIHYDFDLETTYYWKVVATDRFGGTSESNIFSFTTSSIPPPPGPGDIDVDFSKGLCIASVKADLINIGDKDVSNVFWHVSVTGGIFDMLSVSKSGRIDRLNLNEKRDISTQSLLDIKSKVIGLGAVDITIRVTNEDGVLVCSEACDGILLGFLLIITN